MTTKIQLTKPRFVKVKDLERERSGYNVYVKVISAEQKIIDTRDGLKISMINAVVGDETGQANAFFKGESAGLIKKDSVIAIRNGLKRFIKNFISLEVDLFGRVTLEKDIQITLQAEALNISTVEHKLSDKPRNNYRGDNRGNGERDNRRENRGGRGGYRGGRNDNRRQDRGEDRRQDRREDRRPRREYDREDKPRNNEDRPRNNDRNNDRDHDRNNNRNNDRNYDRNNDRNTDRRNNDRPHYDRNNDRNNDRNYDRKPRNNDRDFDRNNTYDRPPRREYTDQPPRREYTEKREENRDRRAPIQWTKVDEINPGEDKLNIIAQVVSVQRVEGKRTMLRVVLGDETGTVNAFLNDEKYIVAGATVALFNAESRVVKEHIEVQVGRGGKIDEGRKKVEKVNESFNLSQKSWVPIQ